MSAEPEDWTAGPKAGWLTVEYDSGPAAMLFCRRCSHGEDLDLPVSLETFTERSSAFVERHRSCKVSVPAEQGVLV